MKTSLLGPLCAVLALSLTTAPVLMAQNHEDCILRITGASSIEELSESEIERFEAFLLHPVCLNTASRSALRASGLFTPFQIASLLDYRQRSGDILSYSELSLLDGFSEALASALRPFVSLETKASAGGSSSRHPFSASLTVRDAVKADEGAEEVGNTLGVKLKATSEGFFEVNAAWRDKPSGSIVYFGKQRLGKFVLGDYNARFGQGLVAWSGFSLSGFSTSSSFCRRASGLSQTCSWTPSMRGLAADFDFGNTSLSAAVSEEIPLLANLTVLKKRITLSATCLATREQRVVSQDALFSLGKWHPYYEVAFDTQSRSAAALAGVQWEWAYRKRASFLIRDYPAAFSSPLCGPPRAGSGTGGERGMALALQLADLDLTFDAALLEKQNCLRFKSVANLPIQLSSSLKLVLRAQEQYRPQEEYAHKNLLRSDLVLSCGPWQYALRMHCQNCRSTALLFYLEAGRKAERVQIWGRLTAFRVPTWDDRIYVYERDAPGSFNVPSYYGTGAAASLYGSYKTKRHRLYLRLSGISYSGDKPSRVEARLQYCCYLR